MFLTILFWYCVVSYVLYGIWCWTAHIDICWRKDSPFYYREHWVEHFWTTLALWVFSPLCFLVIILAFLGIGFPMI